MFSKKDAERNKLLAAQRESSPWQKFLADNELIIKTGLIEKRVVRSSLHCMLLLPLVSACYCSCWWSSELTLALRPGGNPGHFSLGSFFQGLFSKRRQLILTDKPRMLYVDVDNDVVKGEIPWSTDLFPQFKNMKTFFVHTVRRPWVLCAPLCGLTTSHALMLPLQCTHRSPTAPTTSRM